MILVADSGSTKTDWVLIDDKNTKNFHTKGFNPVFTDSDFVKTEIKNNELFNYKDSIEKIYFFGAGCSSKERNSIIEHGLSSIFTKSKIIVKDDLTGAGIAAFGKNNGIIGILGTGSNTGIYKKQEITENIKSLGYILGDEGSGAYIGKLFIKAFLENELPKNIFENFTNEYKINRDIIIKNVYSKPFANRYLASFIPFVHKHKNNEFVENLLKSAFSDFLKKTIIKYNNYKDYELKLVGSVAWFYADIIKEIATKYDINITEILKSPIDNLVKFYIENE